MYSPRKKFDAVVVGAGLSGAAACCNLCNIGLNVALVEALPLSEAGAGWINAIPEKSFFDHGLEELDPAILAYKGGRYIVQSGQQKVFIKETPLVQIDMKRLLGALHKRAEKLGATLFDRCRVVDMKFLKQRPTGIALETRKPGSTPGILNLEASLFVDASGITGAVRRRVPAMARFCRGPDESHVCNATQETWTVADGSGLKNFMEKHGIEPGDTIAWTGVEGGYSTLTLYVPAHMETLELLAGSINLPRYRPGASILRDFCKQQPWIGRLVKSGSGTIPIRRPYDILAIPGLALIGDAGLQVFPAHGSGTHSILTAAKILADTVSPRADPGGERSTWEYQAGFQRKVGAVHAVYDLVTRMTINNPASTTRALLENAILGPDQLTAGLCQELPPVTVGSLFKTFTKLGLISKTGPLTVKAPLVHALYKAYPSKPDMDALGKWSRSVALLFSEDPDIL
ncbi:MAG: NAD(P)/FAD-dependent oxidoreductase [Deltaproteobacteria bacterium]|nr:NAD(P)/FAD-dependent oxidoreductase [Deltaproteobacteria bacterium]